MRNIKSRPCKYLENIASDAILDRWRKSLSGACWSFELWDLNHAFYFTVITFVPQVMSQAEGQQKNLVQSIDSLPTRGPLSCLDQDLLLLKATSAATLSCLGECLNILQQTQSHNQPPLQPSELNISAHRAPSGESATGPVPVLLLELLHPPLPTSLLSSQYPPPEPSSEVLLVQLDGGSSPHLLSINV